MENNDKINLLIMAGGTGSRMNLSDKGLLMIRGQTLIERNMKLLENSVNKIYIAVSSNTEKTEGYFKDKAIVIRTSGRDYSQDIGTALESVETYPVLVIPADVYIRDVDVLNNLIDIAKKNGKGITSMLIEGLFCGISVFMEKPENVDTKNFYGYNVTEQQAYNINTVEDFFLILNRLRKE